MLFNVQIFQFYDLIAVVGVEADNEADAAIAASAQCSPWEHVGLVWPAEVQPEPPDEYDAEGVDQYGYDRTGRYTLGD